MSAYSEKLKDPRWQRKRLEILSRDDFTCQFCKSTEKTLHVHHLGYIKGRDPWDYPNAALLTLCWECHETEGAEVRDAADTIVASLQLRGADAAALYCLACSIDFSGEPTCPPLSRDEWSALANIVRTILADRYAGADLIETQRRLRASRVQNGAG